jgi:hypothetical protein
MNRLKNFLSLLYCLLCESNNFRLGMVENYFDFCFIFMYAN